MTDGKSETQLISGAAKAPTPAHVRETGKPQNAVARTWFGGIVLLTLCVLLGVSMWQKSDLGAAIVAAISGGLGYLLGERSRQDE